MGLCRCVSLSQRFSFISMIFCTTVFFIVEITVGYITNSMALVADSFHMLSDVVSLLVGYFALKFSKVGSQTGSYTFGWARAEVLGALVNAVFLVALCFSIVVEALKRIVITEHLDDPTLVLITGGIGLVVNIVGLFLFHQHGHSHSHGGHGHSHGGHGGHEVKKKEVKDTDDKILHVHNSNHTPSSEMPNLHGDSPGEENEKLIHRQQQSTEVRDIDVAPVKPNKKNKQDTKSPGSLNIRGVYLHVLGDALGSVIVMISAIIIMYVKADWTKYVDPSLSIIMVIIILKTSFPLLKESSMILMQTVPTHMKIQEIQDKLMESVPGILSVHEFHIWQLAGNKIIASAHVHCKTLLDYMKIAGQVKEFFHNQGIHSTTIQPEFVEPISQDALCLLECEETCSERTCCGSTTTAANVMSSSTPAVSSHSLTAAAECSSVHSRPVGRDKNVPV